MAKPGRGRPTSYRPEYCQKLIDHMAQGHSYESFAPVISVSRQSLYQWESVHSEFSDAKKIGLDANKKTLEEIGIKLATGEIQGSTTAWIFMMKNMHGWKDKKEIEASGSIDVRVSGMATPAQLKAALQKDPFAEAIEVEAESESLEEQEDYERSRRVESTDPHQPT